MAVYNPTISELPKGVEFSLVTASFVKRGGFETETDRSKDRENRLPRWVESPILYRIKDGYVIGRHFSKDQYHLFYESELELVKDWESRQTAYLLENGGYGIDDCYDGIL